MIIYAAINSARLQLILAYLIGLSQQKQKNDLILRGESYKHFINAIRSPATRKNYEISLRRYLVHLKSKEVDDLLQDSNPRSIEIQIIHYIMSLKESGISDAIRFTNESRTKLITSIEQDSGRKSNYEEHDKECHEGITTIMSFRY